MFFTSGDPSSRAISEHGTPTTRTERAEPPAARG